MFDYFRRIITSNIETMATIRASAATAIIDNEVRSFELLFKFDDVEVTLRYVVLSEL